MRTRGQEGSGARGREEAHVLSPSEVKKFSKVLFLEFRTCPGKSCTWPLRPPSSPHQHPAFLRTIFHLLTFSSCSFLTINILAQGIKQDPSCQMSTKCVWIGLNTITITSLPGIVGSCYSLLGHLSPLRRTLSLRYITDLVSLFLIFSLRKTSWFLLRFSCL